MKRGARPHIEAALELNLSELIADGLLVPNATVEGNLRWKHRSKGEQRIDFVSDIGDNDGTLRLQYILLSADSDRPKEVSYLINISSIPLHFGGRRFWMHCPYTNRRAAKLYKFAGIDHFCHRTAIRPLPTYASQRVGGLDRLQNKRWRIHRLLKHNGLPYDIPSKPKWMRWRTFERFSEREAALADLDIALQFQWIEKVMAKRRR